MFGPISSVSIGRGCKWCLPFASERLAEMCVLKGAMLKLVHYNLDESNSVANVSSARSFVLGHFPDIVGLASFGRGDFVEGMCSRAVGTERSGSLWGLSRLTGASADSFKDLPGAALRKLAAF